METLSNKILAQKISFQTKAYAIFLLFLLIGLGAYFYFNWQKYMAVADGINANKATISELTKILSDEKTQYMANKASFDALNKEIYNNIKEILPQNEDYKQLTRALDLIEMQMNSPNNPFEVSNLSFQNPTTTDISGVLPFSMSIKCSADNFTKFLKLIQNSGSFDNQIRLMSIASIRLNFEGEGARDKNAMITFNVQLNGYFQK